MNGFFTLNWANVRSAIVYGVLTLLVTFALAITQNILNAGSIFGLDWKHIVDSAVITTLPTLIIIISLGKSLLTSEKGKFVGVVDVVPGKIDGPKKD